MFVRLFCRRFWGLVVVCWLRSLVWVDLWWCFIVAFWLGFDACLRWLLGICVYWRLTWLLVYVYLGVCVNAYLLLACLLV